MSSNRLGALIFSSFDDYIKLSNNRAYKAAPGFAGLPIMNLIITLGVTLL